MRLAVISDIHANLTALEAVLDDIAGKSADSDEGGHQFQFDRGHHSNLMAARLASSRRPVLVMSRWSLSGQAVCAIFGLARRLEFILPLHLNPARNRAAA